MTVNKVDQRESIVIPQFYGVVFLKNERVVNALGNSFEELKSHIKSVAARYGEPVSRGYLDETENLISYTEAMNPHDLEEKVSRYTSLGLVNGIDFVLTSQFTGVISKEPCDWLMVNSPYAYYV
jgi:hypothetical protein